MGGIYGEDNEVFAECRGVHSEAWEEVMDVVSEGIWIQGDMTVVKNFV